MFSKNLFIFAHQLGNINFYPMYQKLLNNQWVSYEDLQQKQEKQLKSMITFVYQNVPYYHKLFDDLKLKPNDVNKIEDLEKLPILTKDDIINNWDDFKPISLNQMKYYVWSTGGSTGNPLLYRVSKRNRFFGGAILYRGWGYGGYKLGDKMVFLAGSSLSVSTKSSIVTKSHEIVRNVKKLSSFDMGPSEMDSYLKIINSFKPKYLRGYPSSINFLANYILENDIKINSPFAIFTTAEKLYPHLRANIENVFECNVYDNYGLNDGDVSAFECNEHNGLHIDTERSIMEVVNDSGSQIDKGIGKILATSLYNYAMPFIRYETGDIGNIVDDSCCCNRSHKLLKEVVGRSTDVLFTPEGKYIHGYFILYIFWEHCKGIKQYQVVQESLNKIKIKIVPDHNFDDKQIELIRNMIQAKSENWEIEFKFVDKIDVSDSAKYKFIMNKLSESRNFI